MDVKLIIGRINDILSDIKNIAHLTILHDGKEDIEFIGGLVKHLDNNHKLMYGLLKILEVSRDELMFVLEEMMNKDDISEFETSDIIVKFKKNPPKVVIHDESKIDTGYYYDKKVLDKVLISEHLKSGIPVEGAELVQDHRLDIKYKSINSKECV